MNPDNTCDNVQPEANPCRSAEITEMCGKQKWEPQNKDLLVCSTKNCQIYGDHDTKPFPDYPCPAKGIKSKDPNKNSLGSPVGLVTSTINFKSEAKPADIGQARFATYLKAFARLYLNPETIWTPELLDDIIREGLALYAASEKEENKLESPNEIYTDSERRMPREFQMSGCQFHIEVMKKFVSDITSSKVPNNSKGDGLQAKEILLVDFKQSLKQFLRSHKYCLVLFGSAIYVMIWRSRGAYFVLDVCGRRPQDFHSDREKGLAMLVCLKSLENIRHLLIGLTNLQKIDSCTLRELKMVKVVMPTGEVVQRDYATRSHEYEIINDDYAYLKASLHLTLNKGDLLRNRSTLPAGIVAIVVSKIDHPATWNMKVLDKILCFAVSFCQAYWINCMVNEAIDLQEFPSLFNMGQFRVQIELKPRLKEGTWRCVPGYGNSELSQNIEKAFGESHQELLIQINYQMYAIWKKQDFIYLLDPYRHRIMGKLGDSEIYEEMEKSATLRMFRSLEVFMNTFNYILLDSNRTSKFYIHTMKIKSIQERKKTTANLGNLEAEVNSDIEVKSLNEHVCFEETDDFCRKTLSEISDYEDEDLISDVDELELKTSSSEAEEGVEEEEAEAGGEEEEMEGLESSSSGEDQKTVKNKEKGGKGKAKKLSKKSKKGDKLGKGDKKGQSKDAKERKKAGEVTDDEDINKTNDKDNQKKDKQKGIPEDEEKQREKEGNKKKADANKEAGSKIDTKKDEQDKDKSNKDNKSEDKNENKEKNKETDLEKNTNKSKDQEKDIENYKSVSPQKPPEPAIRKADKQVEAKLLADHEKDLIPKQRITTNCPKDGTEADDENDEEEDFFAKAKHFCSLPNPNRYPGYFRCPLNMAVVGSENGSYESLSKLLQAGFRRADRLLAMTPWGNFVVFRCMSQQMSREYSEQQQRQQQHYFLFDGCTCNVNRFRHLDLTIGTAGLLCFPEMHNVIEYMRRIRKIRSKENRRRQMKTTADEICQEYCR